MQIGETLKKIREKRNYTQELVCNKLKISQTYLSQVERGRKEPSGEMFRRICKFYKVPHQIVAWQSLTEKDVQPSKRSLYRQLNPVINQLIEESLQ